MKTKTALTTKLIVFLVIGLLIVVPVRPTFAQTAPQPPSTPEEPTTPESPEAPSAPTPPETEDQDSPTQPTAETNEPAPSPSETPTTTPDASPTSQGDGTGEQGSATASPLPGSSPVATAGQTTGSQSGSNDQGDSTIQTGDANSSAIVTTSGNTNSSGSGSGSAEEITVGNQDNGAGSTNSGEVNTTDNSQTIQTNDAQIGNSLELDSVSGDNDTSYNTGDDSVIVTGDANTTATVVNGVNTNLDGVAVVEFNIDDTHTGDVVLAFPTVTGCTATYCGGNASLTSQNTGNGVYSTNDAAIDLTNEQATFQQNSADIVNDIILIADSGSNEADYNTGGDSSITTGDANVVATVGNFVNNNIAAAGEVLIAVVNVFGDLIGNILLPESTLAGSGSVMATNSENGASSANTSAVNTSNMTTTTQSNDANILNNLNVNATTGDNSAAYNTGGFSNGGSVIQTGDAAIDVNAINIANSNLVGGDVWWLVFVNDASGNWVGRIVGAPQGATMAGSAGTELTVLADGTVVAQNTGNGAGSTNTAEVNSQNTTTTTQQNTANITNNITLDANTGKNSTSYNTGGDNSVTTGNANVMANIMNFVNNNIVGGKVVVSVINVFGSWLGSFVPPGEEAPPVPAVGGSNIGGNDHSANQGSGDSGTNTPETELIQQAAITPDTGEETAGDNPPADKKTAFGFGFPFTSTVSDSEEAPKSGGVVEDDSIIVLGTSKTASAKTVVPAWFWKLFAAAAILAVAKHVRKIRKERKWTTAAFK